MLNLFEFSIFRFFFSRTGHIHLLGLLFINFLFCFVLFFKYTGYWHFKTINQLINTTYFQFLESFFCFVFSFNINQISIWKFMWFDIWLFLFLRITNMMIRLSWLFAIQNDSSQQQILQNQPYGLRYEYSGRRRRHTSVWSVASWRHIDQRRKKSKSVNRSNNQSTITQLSIIKWQF